MKPIATINDFDIHQSYFGDRKGQFFAQSKTNPHLYLTKKGFILSPKTTDQFDQFYFDDIHSLFKVVADNIMANNKKKCRVVIDIEYDPRQTDNPKDWNWEPIINNRMITNKRNNFTIVSVEELK